MPPAKAPAKSTAKKTGTSRSNGAKRPAAATKTPTAKTAAEQKLMLDQISPHFRLAEFHCSDGTPVPSKAHAALQDLCVRYLEPMREKFGKAQILSGYRTKAYNIRIGGAAKSQHIYDQHPESVAADVRFEKGTPQQWYDFADQLTKRNRHGGVGKYVDSAFVHLDNRAGQARWSGWQGSGAK